MQVCALKQWLCRRDAAATPVILPGQLVWDDHVPGLVHFSFEWHGLAKIRLTARRLVATRSRNCEKGRNIVTTVRYSLRIF